MSFQDFSQNMGQYFQNSPQMMSKIIITVVVVLVLWLIRLIIVRGINRNIDNTRQKYKWRKNASYFTGFLGLLIIGIIWFEGLQEIGTFLGLLSAGLAIALRDPVTDFAGWIFISLRKPFNVGDRVEIGEVKGDIIDIRIFKFTVLEIGNWIHADQSTGRVVHMPNHKVFTEALANYTSDFEFIWNELQVLVTFESDWKKAKEMLQEVADKHMEDFIEHAQHQVHRANKSYFVHYEYLTPIVYTDVKESGINLTIRHLCDPRKRRGVGQAMWEDILDRFNESDDIDFAYPTMRIMADRKHPSKEKHPGKKPDVRPPSPDATIEKVDEDDAEE
ncbi:MAG: mechanosensitive ion channel family protein [Balneolaceae bacterium]|nr:mechanosensitive ion channel family protein [Balneolaceae bacterium]